MPPALLLVTLDTTRADVLTPEVAPHFAALAARGVVFHQAYATAPQTLPAHASMLTGLYPAGHGVHDNARFLPADRPLLAAELGAAGYTTAAFVSGFPLARQFGLARGFAVYDDDFGPGRVERPAAATTDRALAWLAAAPDTPVFLWVHFYDPHDPYEPPEPYRSRFTDRYLGEIAAMDAELGRLFASFETKFARRGLRVVVAADHGEGRGDHGEEFHGNLLYQGVMRVPLVAVGSGLAAGAVEHPVSTRGLFPTFLGWSRGETAPGVLAPGPAAEPVLGEAMQPFLLYGWQPQVMALRGPHKAIQTKDIELYDVRTDPAEARNLYPGTELPRELRQALREYPLPGVVPPGALTDEARRQLASLGYVAGGTPPARRADAPVPREMTPLLADLDRAARLFGQERWAELIPLLQRLLTTDPGNVSAHLRLGVALAARGRRGEALRAFQRARELAPDSRDARLYLGLHLAQEGDAAGALPHLEAVLAAEPQRLPALLAVGDLAMAAGHTARALDAFERARALQGEGFERWLELGVLYLAERRLDDAREALDIALVRWPAGHPGRPMALFKRAQVAALAGEPDRAEHLRRARDGADATTATLIAREALFH